MRRYALITLIVLAASSAAQAHPLGNFSVNRYSRVEVAEDRIRVRYVLDMAEIPTFQEMAAIDLDRDGRVGDDERVRYVGQKVTALRQDLHLFLNGSLAALRVASQELSFPPGQAGLSTLRLECDFEASMPGGAGESVQRAEYRDDNYADRLGWKEIVVRAGRGIALRGSTAPERDQSDELRTYPQDVLASPPNQREAHFTFVPGSGEDITAEFEDAGRSAVQRSKDSFAALISHQELSVPTTLFLLLIAFGLGALHALSPGHGKTVVAAYLVGARGTARDAIFLGLTVTATHTLSVFALGLVTLCASQFILPERLYPWLSLASGFAVVGIGLGVFFKRLRSVWPGGVGSRRHGGHHHPARACEDEEVHHHGDGLHEHSHPHSHAIPGADGSPITRRSLLALGMSGGLLPCPSALVVLLSAIALRRVGFGLALIVAFSAGLAGVLTGIGLLFVYARRFLEGFRTDNALVRALPAVSALVVAGVGSVIAAQALSQIGLPPQGLLEGFIKTTTFSVLALGFALGIKHALDADHLVAVSTIVSERKGLRGSSLVGAVWGLGHTASLLAVGLAVIALHAQIPERVAQAMEFGVAVMLVGLGLNLLRKLLSGATFHAHPHRHGGCWHLHPHLHEARGHGGPDAPSDSHHALRVGKRPFLIGMVHGLAGSAALMLLVLATIPSRALGFAYIGVFGLGSVGGMLVMSTLIGLPFAVTAHRFERLNAAVQALAGGFSVGLGLWLMWQIGTT